MSHSGDQDQTPSRVLRFLILSGGIAASLVVYRNRLWPQGPEREILGALILVGFVVYPVKFLSNCRQWRVPGWPAWPVYIVGALLGFAAGTGIEAFIGVTPNVISVGIWGVVGLFVASDQVARPHTKTGESTA